MCFFRVLLGRLNKGREFRELPIYLDPKEPTFFRNLYKEVMIRSPFFLKKKRIFEVKIGLGLGLTALVLRLFGAHGEGLGLRFFGLGLRLQGSGAFWGLGSSWEVQ